MRSIMVKIDNLIEVSALHIVYIKEVKPFCEVGTTTVIYQTDCNKVEMKRRIDAAWEGR